MLLEMGRNSRDSEVETVLAKKQKYVPKKFGSYVVQQKFQ
jgi:hypothetical protein